MKRGTTTLVCSLVTSPLTFPDNRTGKCCECGRLVQFRPHAPRRARLLCMACADLEMAAAEARGEKVKAELPPRMLEDVITYLRRQKQ